MLLNPCTALSSSHFWVTTKKFSHPPMLIWWGSDPQIPPPETAAILSMTELKLAPAGCSNLPFVSFDDRFSCKLHQFPPMFDYSQEVYQMRFGCNKVWTFIGNIHNTRSQHCQRWNKKEERFQYSFLYFCHFLKKWVWMLPNSHTSLAGCL